MGTDHAGALSKFKSNFGNSTSKKADPHAIPAEALMQADVDSDGENTESTSASSRREPSLDTGNISEAVTVAAN